MSNWHEEIKEREFHGKPEGKWIVIGWYADEKEAYSTAETAWEKKQQEGWENQPKVTLAELAEGDGVLGVDDYFRWNVDTPHWFLHKNGTWHKMLCACGEGIFGPNLMSGEYGSEESAREVLKRSSKPRQFENYQEHLQTAREPII